MLFTTIFRGWVVTLISPDLLYCFWPLLPNSRQVSGIQFLRQYFCNHLPLLRFWIFVFVTKVQGQNHQSKYMEIAPAMFFPCCGNNGSSIRYFCLCFQDIQQFQRLLKLFVLRNEQWECLWCFVAKAALFAGSCCSQHRAHTSMKLLHLLLGKGPGLKDKGNRWVHWSNGREASFHPRKC